MIVFIFYSALYLLDRSPFHATDTQLCVRIDKGRHNRPFERPVSAICPFPTYQHVR